MTSRPEIWGVLGGMGPLASAEFVRSIYEETVSGPEQNCPIVFLLSDPTVPDRTECFLNGQEDLLLAAFSEKVGQLAAWGATRIIIACFTIHPLVPRLPEDWQKKIISLVDLTLEAVIASGRKHLLICTTGSRKMRLFECHKLWEEARSQIVLPGDDDQARIHQMIYEIKSNHQDARHINLVEDLLAKYKVGSYIAGCTEIHILAKQHEQATGRDRRDFCIDGLTEVLSFMRNSFQQPALSQPT